MQVIRVWIEGFLRGRYGLAVPALIVAILVSAGLLIASLKASMLIPPVPRFTSDGDSLVRNGVAVIVACGEKRRLGVLSAPEPRTGSWTVQRHGDCNIFLHHPPDAIQRENRHQRTS